MELWDLFCSWVELGRVIKVRRALGGIVGFVLFMGRTGSGH